MNNKVEIIKIHGIPHIKKGDNISQIILDNLENNNIEIENKDILIIAQKIISKSLGLVKDLRKIKPRKEALRIFNKINSIIREPNLPVKDPELIEIILDESNELIKINHVLITETKHGFVCANAGIDKSNIKGQNNVTLLPDDPDKEAKKIKEIIKERIGKNIAVIISDSFGRPFRNGSVGVALGVAGIEPLLDKRGCKDLYGKILRSTIIAQIDNLSSAAQLIMGESNEGIPIALIRGYNFKLSDNSSIKSILREKKKDLFRQENVERVIEDLLKNRRSYKLKFANKDVNEDLIINCINIARYAPSAHNKQLWKYIILEKQNRKELIDNMNQKLKDDLEKDDKSEKFIKNKINKTRSHFLEAPFLILLSLDCSEIDEYSDLKRNNNEFLLGIQGISASAIYFLLALESKGLNSCWYSAPLFAEEVVQKTLNLPKNFKPIAFFTIGYPKKKILAQPRKKIDEIIYKI